jgi:hypothetical protein
MIELVEVIVGLVAGGLFFVVAIRRWHRRQKAARLADVLLSDVLKAKDSYRR